MYRDLSNGYPTESEHILGDLVDRPASSTCRRRC